MRLTCQVLSQYFKRYVEKELYGPTLRRKWRPIQGWKEMKKTKFNWNEHRPWTEAFKQDNFGRQVQNVLVEPIKEPSLFKGDRVELLVGPDKGKHGIINSIIKERNWVFVEGLNCEYKMIRQGREIMPICQKIEKPLLITNQVKLVDPGDEKATDCEWRYTEKGRRERVSVRTGRIIPLPTDAHELDDFVNPLTYVDGESDCDEKIVKKVTYQPVLKLFEDDIMEKMGIKEDRKRAKTYWH